MPYSNLHVTQIIYWGFLLNFKVDCSEENHGMRLKDRIGFPKNVLTFLIHLVCLILILFIAFTVRILPLKWGAYLNEFDPFWHWYVAKHIVENGVDWIFKNSWVDLRTWFPYGRHVASTTPMGLPLTAAVFYLTLKSLGLNVSLLNVAIYLPPFMAAVTCLTLYFWGRDVGGRETGILAGLFLALNTAYIGRTTLGFFKHESVGIFAIVLFSLLFFKALNPEKPLKTTILYSVFAGLTLAYLNISWGAFYYMLGLIPLFVFLLLLTQKYTEKLFITYTIVMVLSTILTIPFPRPGYRLLTSMGFLPVVGGFLLLGVYEGLIKRFRFRFLFLPITITIIVVALLGLYFAGIVSPLATKILTAMNPILRRTSPLAPVVESVAEHKMSTWATFYRGFGVLPFFMVLGMYFAFKRRRPVDIYLIVFGLTSVYAAASFIRLNLILAPVACLLAAYGITEMVKPLTAAIKNSLASSKEKRKTVPLINPIIGLVFIVILVLSIVPSFMEAVDSAYMPVTIASASVPIREYRADWFDALKWISKNVPVGTPVVCWWDYGYWVAIGGNSTTVADNATINTTQIANVGQVLLSNETTALKLSRKYFRSDYILVFITTFPVGGRHQPWGYGDEGKWIWMYRIAHLYHPNLKLENIDKDRNRLPDKNTLLGKLIYWACGIPVKFEKFKVVYASPSHQYVLNGTVIPTTQVIIVKGID